MNIVIVNCFDTWEQRADLLYKVMTESGHKVKVLISDFQHINKKHRFEKKQGYKFFMAKPYKKNLSINRLHSHLQLGRDFFSFIEQEANQIDLLWVFAPPNSFVREAANVKKRHSNIKLIIDIIDLWPETIPTKKMRKMPFLTIWRNLRDDNLKSADLVITECNLYKNILDGKTGNARIETLYLARESKKCKPDLQLPDKEIALCYLGSINHIIDIDAIGSIINQCRKINPVIFHIIGDGEKRDHLINVARRYGAKVIYHGKVYDRKEKQKIFDSCHYGLNIMKDCVCVGLTMKSVDYLEFGLPIINNIKGDTWEAVQNYEIGINFKEKLLLTISDNEYKRENAKEFFKLHFTEDVFKKKVLEILHETYIENRNEKSDEKDNCFQWHKSF